MDGDIIGGAETAGSFICHTNPILQRTKTIAVPTALDAVLSLLTVLKSLYCRHRRFINLFWMWKIPM
jgi:hypothetical protein